MDDWRAKREAEEMNREEERESKMFALLSSISMFGSSAPPPHGQHYTVPPVSNMYQSPTMPPSIPSFSMYSFLYSPGGDDDEEDNTFTP